jgi:hypothetical protein
VNTSAGDRGTGPYGRPHLSLRSNHNPGQTALTRLRWEAALIPGSKDGRLRTHARRRCDRSPEPLWPWAVPVSATATVNDRSQPLSHRCVAARLPAAVASGDRAPAGVRYRYGHGLCSNQIVVDAGCASWGRAVALSLHRLALNPGTTRSQHGMPPPRSSFAGFQLRRGARVAPRA